MRELVFALEFKGHARPVPGEEGKLRAETTASGQVLRTSLMSKGVEARVQPARGSARFESEVQMTGDGSFVESGSITYGKAGRLTFKTVGQGVIGPSAIEGMQRGAVIWEVTGGDKQFAGATGLITSNFTAGPQGEVVDNQFARLFLPS